MSPISRNPRVFHWLAPGLRRRLSGSEEWYEANGFPIACAPLTPTAICGRLIRGSLEIPGWRQGIIYSKNPVRPTQGVLVRAAFRGRAPRDCCWKALTPRRVRTGTTHPALASLLHPSQEGNFVPLTCRGFGESGQAAVGVDHPAKRRLQGFPIERCSRGSI